MCHKLARHREIKGMKLGGWRGGKDMGGAEEGNHDQNILYEIFSVKKAYYIW